MLKLKVEFLYLLRIDGTRLGETAARSDVAENCPAYNFTMAGGISGDYMTPMWILLS
jgi:hypothetical protein